MSIGDIFDVVAAAAPEIRAGLPGRRVKTEQENVSGERQTAADVWADDLLCDCLTDLDVVGTYASEEREEPVDAGDGYAVAVDPLDGSSNLKSNNPMGTVVGVYDADLPASGRDLVAAGFVLYGPITTMVVAREARSASERASGDEPRAGDRTATEYVVEDGTEASHASEAAAGTQVDRRDVGTVEIADDPTVYGFGGRVPDWTEDFTDYVHEVERELKLRYGGAMIADVSQVLTYGGIFGYPGLRDRPEGKLRLLFEGAPMAYIVEAAGGASSDGSRSLLDVEAEDLHQRTPVFLGNDEYVDRLEDALGDRPSPSDLQAN